MTALPLHETHLEGRRGGHSREDRGGTGSGRGVGVFRVLHGQRVDKMLHSVHLPLLQQLGCRSGAEDWVLCTQSRQCYCTHKDEIK